jgi:hypothetical protein
VPTVDNTTQAGPRQRLWAAITAAARQPHDGARHRWTQDPSGQQRTALITDNALKHMHAAPHLRPCGIYMRRGPCSPSHMRAAQQHDRSQCVLTTTALAKPLPTHIAGRRQQSVEARQSPVRSFQCIMLLELLQLLWRPCAAVQQPATCAAVGHETAVSCCAPGWVVRLLLLLYGCLRIRLVSNGLQLKQQTDTAR